MGIVQGGLVIAKILEEWGVKYVFTIQGMHIWLTMDALHERFLVRQSKYPWHKFHFKGGKKWPLEI